MSDKLIDVISRLQSEVESVCVRGLRSIGSEQLNWLRHTQTQLAEMGAQFLAKKMAALLEAIDSDSNVAAARLLDLLTSIRVFERVLTLEHAAKQLKQLQAVESAQ